MNRTAQRATGSPPGLSEALAGLPGRVVRAAETTAEYLRAVVCEVGRPPQLWASSGKSVVLQGTFSHEELMAAIQAMAPWGDDGISGVDGTLHFRMRLDSPQGPRGVIVHLHHHRTAEPDTLLPLLREVCDLKRQALVILGPPEEQEHVLREVCRLASSTLGLSTVLVDPEGRIGGRGRIPDRSLGGAAWVRTGTAADVPYTCQKLLRHARPKVVVTVLQYVSDCMDLLRTTGGVSLVCGLPLAEPDPQSEDLTRLSAGWPLAAVLARPGAIEVLPDLQRALAMARAVRTAGR